MHLWGVEVVTGPAVLTELCRERPLPLGQHLAHILPAPPAHAAAFGIGKQVGE